MGKHRKPYPAEFRTQMVGLVKAGRTREELERDILRSARSGEMRGNEARNRPQTAPQSVEFALRLHNAKKPAARAGRYA